METHTFQALGTTWNILVDHARYEEIHQQEIIKRVALFEQRFSRFLPESEVNQFRTALPGVYPVSEGMAVLLARADQLRTLTYGRYDPAVGGLLERAGYGLKTGQVAESPEDFRLPRWSLVETTLTIDGAVTFDFGGIGKGYCIDLVASALEQLGYQYYLVEGGGDMYGTTKRDGSPYRIALEWPGKPDTAFGLVTLNHQGVAVSDSFRRRWQNWHHIVDPQTKQTIEAVIGCSAVSGSAFEADSMTSALFHAPLEHYPRVAEALEGQYVVFQSNGTVSVSGNWPGELY